LIAICLGALIVAGPALAGVKLPPPTALAAGDRTVAGGRAVLVALPQSQIGTDVDVGRVMSDTAYGGGLIGAIILSDGDHKKQSLMEMDARKAANDAAPLRQAIQDVEFDKLALASTRSALSRLDWFGAQEPKPVKSASMAEMASFARDAGAGQLATVTYGYALSPDFTQIRVIADVGLWRATVSHAKGAPVTLSPLAQQRIVAITELRTRSYDHAENAAHWAADNGRLARVAITTGLARMEQLIPFALGLSQAEIDTLGGNKSYKLFAAGFYGPPVKAFASAPGETLIWSKGLINLMPAPEATASGGTQ
jgi:hypothetical protein